MLAASSVSMGLMHSAHAVISAATGLNRATMLGIWADVKDNGAKLAACQRHEFVSESPGKMGAKWRCTACGGTVSGTNAHWYSLGRKHG